MADIFACVDGSIYADSVIDYAAWIGNALDRKIQLVHAQALHNEEALVSDLSGAIGIDAQSVLLEKLAAVDEERGKLDQKKGQLILDHAKERLKEQGVTDFKVLHQRGALVDVVVERDAQIGVVVMGKRGEHAPSSPIHFGVNLERVLRVIHKPLLAADKSFRPVKKIALAFDGGESGKRAIDWLAGSRLAANGECHILTVETDDLKTKEDLDRKLAEDQRSQFETHIIRQASKPSTAIAKFVENNQIDLLLMGAYSHSRIRQLFIGSTTSELLGSCACSLLLFR